MENKIKVTAKGKPVTLIGNPVSVGDKARDFTVLKNDLTPMHLADSAGKIRVFNVVPSLDTSICDAQTRRFNEEFGKIDKNIVVITVSMDLPFAQKRWCGASGLENVITVSDHKDALFGVAFGVLNKESRLLARAVFVADKNDVVRYVEYVKEISSHPNYEAAIEAVKSIL